MNIGQLLAHATTKLSPAPEARLEAEVLLGHALEVKRSFLYANSTLDVPLKRANDYSRLIKRRLAGEPIAYLVGRRAFWTLDLMVTPDVLIPRPETELLVEAVLRVAAPGSRFRLADLGTGSGAIALALARERPTWEVCATDNCPKALHVAQTNALRNNLPDVSFRLGEWTEPLDGLFDLLVSNPPYVAESDPHLLKGDCRFEPKGALSAGQDGLSAIRQIATESIDLLKPGGSLLLEHGYDQGESVRDCLRTAGFDETETLQDLAGHDRVCKARKEA